MEFIIANASTIIIGLVLLCIVLLIVRSMYYKAKSGKCVSCDCANKEQGCHGGCGK